MGSHQTEITCHHFIRGNVIYHNKLYATYKNNLDFFQSKNPLNWIMDSLIYMR